MIDGQPGTAYGFPASDAAPAAIIDLGRSVSVNRISTFSTPSSATVTFYLLGALPGNNTGNLESSLRIDPQTLAAFRTVGTGNDDGSGRVAVDFEETTGRYVMLVWTRPREMQISLSLKLLSSAQPATRGCWRKILLETTLPILRTARLFAIRRMQKTSARRLRRRSEGAGPRRRAGA